MKSRKVLCLAFCAMLVLSLIACFVLQPIEAQAKNQEVVRYQKMKSEQVLQLLQNHQAPACDAELLEQEPSGYLFGGWFTYIGEGKSGKPIKALSDVKNAEYVYAKFVPARITAVACQVGVDAQNTGSTTMRIVSAVDSTDYLAVGFNVYGRRSDANGINDWTMYQYNPETVNKAQKTSVYSSLQTYRYSEDRSTVVKGDLKKPEDIFGADAAGFKFTTMNLSGIPQDYYGVTIVIQPYWITLDGTYVPGNLEFNRVNDSPNLTTTQNVVNISVNLQDASQIAAGIVEIAYPEGYTLLEAECGRVFEEMSFSVNAEKRTILCIGNTASLENSVNPQDVYVNLRFEKFDNALKPGQSEFYVRIPEKGFCSIDEVYQSVIAWNIVH